ncbi:MULTISPECIES: hypothetical protein [unclassified Moorena]|nr:MULTISPECIES: hypothetical protein [unclassified Moorena]
MASVLIRQANVGKGCQGVSPIDLSGFSLILNYRATLRDRIR